MKGLSDLVPPRQTFRNAREKAKTEIAEKITRATFIYLDPKKPKSEFAQCETCIHFLGDRCEWMSARDEVDDDDSCCFYVHGKAAAGTQPKALMTKKEMGFVSRQVRCENCCFFDNQKEPRDHCDLYTQLNLILPGVFALDRYVDHQGCCNAQTPGTRNPKVFGPFGPIQHGDQE